MNEDKRCLQRDTAEGRCLEEGYGKNMLDVCRDLTRCDEYVVMVKTGRECQPQLTCRHTVTSATLVCCAEVLFQSVSAVPAGLGSSNASVVIWSGERSTPSTTARNTEDLLFTTHSLTAGRLYRVKKRVLPTIHAWIVPSCVVVTRFARTHTSRRISKNWSTYFAEVGTSSSATSWTQPSTWWDQHSWDDHQQWQGWQQRDWQDKDGEK